MRIKILETNVANQIAAGEVIERPASVVKELIENSLDAHSSTITLELRAGGLEGIRVRDNGHGIHPEDLKLAIHPHATSKIASIDDLQRLQTLGFRGEALASIASVSRLTIRSRFHELPNAYQLLEEGVLGQYRLEICAHPEGTDIEVNDLFFNFPVRKKFLRSERTEYEHVETLFRRFALSHFNVEFILIHNDKKIFHLPPCADEISRDRRVSKICGSPFLQNALKINLSASELTLSGWMLPAEYSRTQADIQYFYLNGRIIRDRVIQHALRQAISQHLPEGRHGAYVLYLDMPTQQVDVNAHPTKYEVRFHDNHLIHGFLQWAIHNCFQGNKNSYFIPTNRHHMTSGSTSNALPSAFASHPEAKDKTLNYLGVANQKFFVVARPDAFWLIDQVQAIQNWMYARIQGLLKDGPLASMPLLMPHLLPLSRDKAQIIESHLSLFKGLGLELAFASDQQLMVRQIPKILSVVPLESLMSSFLNQLETNFDREKIIAFYALSYANAVKNRDIINPQLVIEWLFEREEASLKAFSLRIDYPIFSKEPMTV